MQVTVIAQTVDNDAKKHWGVEKIAFLSLLSNLHVVFNTEGFTLSYSPEEFFRRNEGQEHPMDEEYFKEVYTGLFKAIGAHWRILDEELLRWEVVRSSTQFSEGVAEAFMEAVKKKISETSKSSE